MGTNLLISISLLIVISVWSCWCLDDVDDDNADWKIRDDVRSPPSESEILLVNIGLNVAFGRSVQVDPEKDLKIQVRHGDRCVVRVLQSGDFRVFGALTPRQFPCQFGADDVRYSHFGSRTSNEDRVKLLLRYDTADDTIIVPFTLPVRVSFERLEVTTKCLPLVVDRLRGQSNPIDRRTLQFTFDRKAGEQQVCRVGVPAKSRLQSLPRYGELVNYDMPPEVNDDDDSDGGDDNDYGSYRGMSFVDCDAFIRSNVRYRHTADGKSPDRDSVPLVVQILDGSGNVVKQENVQMTVHIKGAAENSPPQVNLNSLLLMDVNQFVMTPLTPDVLGATDEETPDDELIFNLTAPISAGELVSSDDQNLQITSFTQRELKLLKIAYRPPASDADIQRIFSLSMEVVDSDGLSSEPFTLLITVSPMNSAAPIVTRNTGISLFEGQSRRLQSDVNLEISDEDNVDDVSIVVINGLRHGRLLIVDTEVRRFTPADLDSGFLRYEHDGSDTFSDNIVFRMSDDGGQHNVEFLFPVSVFPVNDEPPVLTVNTGLVLQSEDVDVQITPFELSAADGDNNDDASIRFVLETEHSGPAHGEIVERRAAIDTDLVELEDESSNWIVGRDGLYERTVTEWTQEDLMEGRIAYRRHPDLWRSRGLDSRTVMDSFSFRLKDDSDPPNVSQVKQFLVKIFARDHFPPEVYPNTPLHMIVDELQMKELTRDHLRFTDDSSLDESLRFTVTTPLYDLDDNSRFPAGKLVATDNPDSEVTSFTQAEINHRRISYRPPPVESGLTRRMIQFGFQVEDDAGNARSDQVFTIILQPIDNRPPKVFNAGFTVFENGFARLDTAVLDASDPDTDLQLLSFRVVRLPGHGSLRKRNESRMIVGDRFDRDDLVNGSVLSYLHDGDEDPADSFAVEVTDGVHFVPATVHVVVKPVDDQPPSLLNAATSGAIQLEVFEGGGVVLDPDLFAAFDPDTEDDQKLTFVVQVKPKHGLIRDAAAAAAGRGRSSLERFNQVQVRKKLVEYRHVGGEIGRQFATDSFNLTLTDMSTERTSDNGNAPRHMRVNVSIRINPVDNVAPNVTVTSQVVVLEGQKRVVNADNLKISDSDSEVQDIVCTIMTQPEHGYLEVASRAPGSERSRSGTAITAFQVHDLLHSSLNYVQSVHRGVEPRGDVFVVQCSDGTNESDPAPVSVIIEPANDEKPMIIVGDHFDVVEGMQLPLDPSILSATDLDQPDDALVFTVVRKPRHGRITLLSMEGELEVDEYHLDQIVNINDSDPKPVMTYAHDDSETLEDDFELELSDGHPDHSVRTRIVIAILPTDDETPRLTINNGVELEVGVETSKTITNRVLKAEDVDSDDASVIYVIRSAPRRGHIRLLGQSDAVNLTDGDQFLQSDIDAHSLEYVIHDGRLSVSGRDLIRLDLSDGVNVLVDQHVHVTIRGADDVYPEVVSRGVALPEGGRVILTTDILSTSDLNSDDELLTFVVTRAPSKGHLENSDYGQPSMPIQEFSQLQLAGNKISYVHTSLDETPTDSFEFEVTDGRNSVYRTFRISLVDVDNKKPILFLSHHESHDVVVREGGFRLLSPFQMKIEDEDHQSLRTAGYSPKANSKQATLLTFTVTQVPLHGTLLYNRSRSVLTFTMDDLERNLIGYEHDASETSCDTFSVVVTDGTHDSFYVHPRMDEETRRPQIVSVVVLPVDNCLPQIVVNKGATSLKPLRRRRRDDGGDYSDQDSASASVLIFRLSDRVLKADDRDSDNARLRYVVLNRPRHGRLVSAADAINGHQENLMNFTQDDLDERNVMYILDHGSNATNDVFTFKVIDTGGNELLDQVFRLNWPFVSLEYESYMVNETEIFLRVNLRRRGYLGETSFVGMMTMDGSAKKGHDFQGSYAKQVQFNPGQSEATWKIRITQDDFYERREQFRFSLEEPIMAVLESPDSAVVTIVDDEDESVVSFADETLKVSEDVGELLIPVRRTGDLSEELVVMCWTVSGTATGTIPTAVTSYSDYISRPADQPSSAVHFDGQQEVAHCRIVIIDDSLLEDDEQFRVSLGMPVGGRIGQYRATDVIILPDPKDSPSVYFGQSSYLVDESDGQLDVTVFRTGSDVSKAAMVTVQSKPTNPPSAKAGKDYVGVSRVLKFTPGLTLKTFRVKILDDLSKPRLDRSKTFELLLKLSSGAIVGEPGRVTVTIDDSKSDLPKMEFRETDLRISEGAADKLVAVIIRSGDLSHASTVRCYTRQDTALVQMDFEERPDTNESIVSFAPAEVEKPCLVNVLNDDLHEPDEVFRLVLGSAQSPSAGRALIGPRNSTRITINDSSDKSIIKFEKIHLNVLEPKNRDDVDLVSVTVVRVGDKSRSSVVRVHTQDGSAQSGIDYTGFSKELLFSVNVSRLTIPIEILADEERELRESFSVHLKPDKNMIAEIKDFKAIVYILEGDSIADVIFPSPPMIVSLRDYDDAGSASKHPAPGYPVVCLTSCNPKHPDFASTGTLCTREGVDDLQSEFRWRVSASSRTDRAANELQDIQSEVFFASIRRITLDSIYFNSGSRIQCIARAVNKDGDRGLEVQSAIVTVSESGLCIPHVPGSYGAEPFTAKLRYTGTDDDLHPNLVKLSVVIPHRDGLLPVVSTSPLSNFDLTLSRNGAHVGNHKCSNLIDVDELNKSDDGTQYGFLTSSVVNSDVVGEVEPYQYDVGLRSEPTLRFYRNLDLDGCMWKFESYYGMSELVNECGAIIDTDGQVLNSVQSHVSVRIPLYVSYVFHSPVSKGISNWQHGDLSTQLRLTFVYDTSVIWQQGILSASRESPIEGHLYPTSMRIKHDGRLLVHFRTEARFRGHFLLIHPGSNVTSMVMSSEHPDLTFNLELVRTDPTFTRSSQEWKFSSDFSIRDYSGTYLVKLIPCTVKEEYSPVIPAACEARELMDFEMRIRFQQVSDPVATRYSLDTRFQLMQSKDLWLHDDTTVIDDDSDVSFQPGETVYGRIMVDSVQNLGTALRVDIDKCFVCTGIDGYVPKFDPSTNEYGCVSNSPNLLFSFKLIDVQAPSTVQREFRDIPFNAVLASEDEMAAESDDVKGHIRSDCFRLDSTPLFQVSHGRQWFVQCIYTIRAEEYFNGFGNKRRSKRTAFDHDRDFLNGVGDEGRGTNMHGIILAHVDDSASGAVPQHVDGGRNVQMNAPRRNTNNNVFFWVLISAVLAISLAALLIVVRTSMMNRRKRSDSSEGEPRRKVSVDEGARVRRSLQSPSAPFSGGPTCSIIAKVVNHSSSRSFADRDVVSTARTVNAANKYVISHCDLDEDNTEV